MLVRVGAEQCRFLHDRIQQAAHSLSSEAQRQEAHLRIGRLLLASLSPEQVRESLFEVVSQLNAGVARMEDPTERHHLARLNADAGGKAQAALALRPAVTYFTTAFALIPADPWETDHALAFQVRLAQARTELMSGAPSEAQRLAEELRPRARTRADTVAVYVLTQDIHLATGRFLEGMNSMRECLALLGMPVSRHPTREEAVAAHEEVWTLLGQRPIESLIELPLMSDPDVKMAVVALYRLFTGAYSTDPHLLTIVLSRIVSLSLRHGFVDAAVTGYAWFGAITGSFFKRYREGQAFARLAHGFLERHHLSVDRATVLLSMQLSSYWVQPIARAQELVLNALHHALQSGDVAAASFCSVYIFSNRLAMGHNLDEVYQESLVRGEYLSKTGFLDLQDWLLLGQRYVQQLRGHSLSFSTLSGEGFDERAYEARTMPERIGGTQCYYWVIKLQSRFMCGAYREAREAADNMLGLLWAQCGSLLVREGHFYRALTLAACFEEASPQEQ
ncbi:MAG TPA: histidine kinase, partial [Cystobacter sp.]